VVSAVHFNTINCTSSIKY